MFYVYILKSSLTEMYYIGQTKDIVKRFNHHNSSKARWTKRFQPWELVHKEYYKTRSEAMKREKFLKNLSKVKLLNLIPA